MRKQYLIIEHRQPELVYKLRNQLADAQSEVSKLRSEVSALSHKFGWEINLNAELIDILKAHGINFRDELDYSKHPF